MDFSMEFFMDKSMEKSTKKKKNHFGNTVMSKTSFGFRHYFLYRLVGERYVEKQKRFFFRPVYNSSFSPPYRGTYTILFVTRCYNGFFARLARKIHYSAPRDITHVDYYTAAVLHYTYMY